MAKIIIPFLILTLFSGHSFSESFSYNETLIESVKTEKVFECEGFKVLLVTDEFPYKYNKVIPKKNRIEGFSGWHLIINKEATLQPWGYNIPRLNKIVALEDKLPKGKTYLPYFAACEEKRLIISYFSGGVCKECQKFVEFKVQQKSLINPKIVSSEEFAKLRDPKT